MLSVIGIGIYYFLTVIESAIFISVLMGWFVDPYNRFLQLLYAITEPFVAPIRALLSRFMGDTPIFDFSPMIAILLLNALKQVFLVIFG